MAVGDYELVLESFVADGIDTSTLKTDTVMIRVEAAQVNKYHITEEICQNAKFKFKQNAINITYKVGSGLMIEQPKVDQTPDCGDDFELVMQKVESLTLDTAKILNAVILNPLSN